MKAKLLKMATRTNKAALKGGGTMFITVVDPKMVSKLTEKGVKPISATADSKGLKLFVYDQSDINKMNFSSEFEEGKSYYFTNRMSF